MRAAEEIIAIIGSMSLEELLETYKDADKCGSLAESSLLRLLITAELDKRING